MTQEKRNLLYFHIKDKVEDLVYNDRKEDEELTLQDMQDLYKSDIEFMIEAFITAIAEKVGD